MDLVVVQFGRAEKSLHKFHTVNHLNRNSFSTNLTKTWSGVLQTALCDYVSCAGVCVWNWKLNNIPQNQLYNHSYQIHKHINPLKKKKRTNATFRLPWFFLCSRIWRQIFIWGPGWFLFRANPHFCGVATNFCIWAGIGIRYKMHIMRRCVLSSSSKRQQPEMQLHFSKHISYFK